jgi:hypothetical protein
MNAVSLKGTALCFLKRKDPLNSEPFTEKIFDKQNYP